MRAVQPVDEERHQTIPDDGSGISELPAEDDTIGSLAAASYNGPETYPAPCGRFCKVFQSICLGSPCDEARSRNGVDSEPPQGACRGLIRIWADDLKVRRARQRN